LSSNTFLGVRRLSWKKSIRIRRRPFGIAQGYGGQGKSDGMGAL